MMILVINVPMNVEQVGILGLARHPTPYTQVPACCCTTHTRGAFILHNPSRKFFLFTKLLVTSHKVRLLLLSDSQYSHKLHTLRSAGISLELAKISTLEPFYNNINHSFCLLSLLLLSLPLVRRSKKRLLKGQCSLYSRSALKGEIVFNLLQNMFLDLFNHNCIRF